MFEEIYTAIYEFCDKYSTFIMVWFYGYVCWIIIDDVRKSHRLRKGKDIIVHPQLTLITEDGDKIHVLSINEEQGRYVLYHSRTNGLQLATHREFLKLKSGRNNNDRS